MKLETYLQINAKSKPPKRPAKVQVSGNVATVVTAKDKRTFPIPMKLGTKWFLRNRCPKEKFLFARQMRKNPTPQERKLWQQLRCKRLAGSKWRRQTVIRGFIVDFYCPAQRLALEVDGAWHEDRAEYDAKRTAALAELSIRVIRISNREIDGKLAEVLAKIAEAANPTPIPHPVTPASAQ